MKKKFIFLGILVVLIIGTCFVFVPTRASLIYPCPFCDPTIINNQKFYEDDCVIALCTHKPIAPGHCLIIPKRHVERFEGLNDEEITQVGLVIQKVHAAAMRVYGTSPYLLLQKNGTEVGQTVPHVHFHYLPRKLSDNSSLTFIVKMYLSSIKKPLTKAQMQENVDKMRLAMEQEC